MPGDAAVNRPAACLPAGLLLQRRTAFQGGLQASELLEDLDRALKDRPLDTGKFLTDPGVGLAGAGLDVDEHCTARVQCDGQLEREAEINLRKSRWNNDLATRCGLRVSHGVSERRKSRYPLGLREKHAETERSGGSAAARSRAEDVA